MHLRNYPQYFVKDGKRRPVYYTADASSLLAMGWKREEEEKPVSAAQEEKKTKPEPGPESEIVKPEKVEVEIVEDSSNSLEEVTQGENLPEFDFMTKNELIKFAADCGETLSVTSLKSDLVDACKKLVRARDTRGRFLSDDPSTPDVNEAWTIG